MIRRKSWKKKYNKEDIDKQNQLFTKHWASKVHYCESCNIYLGSQNKTIFHDHLLEKNKYPDFKNELWNLYLVCLACHDEKTRGFPTVAHRAAIQKAKELANL
jgi:hypothetical protein